MAERETLDAIGLRHGTDKSSRGHGYLTVYERLLSPLRDAPVTLLEIGVFGGASLRMWRDYFLRGRIVGLDVDPAAAIHAGERIEVRSGDQADPAGLAELVREVGAPDVLLDDGSHVWAHQIATLRTLLPLVRPGGLYILEDLHTGYGKWAPKYRGEGGETGAAYCYRVAERLLSAGSVAEPVTDDPLMRDAPRLIESVTIARRVAIFRRRA